MSGTRRQRRKAQLWWIVVGAVVVVAGLIGASWWGAQSPIKKDYPYALAEEYPSLGAADAPVVIEEYADFQCPYCGNFARTAFKQLEHDFIDQNEVKFVYRYMAFLGTESNWAAEAAQCAHDQGKFWTYHDVLFQRQSGENKGAFTKDKLKGLAQELDLDTEAFDQCLDSGRYTEFIKNSTKQGGDRGVKGTPTIFINDQTFTGNWQNFSELSAQIHAAANGS